MTVRLVVDGRDRLGECALWCERTSALYWTDIEGSRIRCLQADGQVREWNLPGRVGSFALTPHSPLQYRGEPPPTFPSEWRPDQFSYATMGGAYDHFLLRGTPPERVLGEHLGQELSVAGQAGGCRGTTWHTMVGPARPGERAGRGGG